MSRLSRPYAPGDTRRRARPRDRPAPASAGTSVDVSADTPADAQRAITALEASLAVLREQLDRAEAGQGLERNRADRAENRADAAEKRAGGAESRADRIDPTRPRVERLVGIASALPRPGATGGEGDAP